MIKYENLTLKIYIRNIKHYTDIDPTIGFVFLVNKIDREDSEKNSFLEKIVTKYKKIPVIQTICFRCRDFQSAEKKSAKIKCLLFRPKPQKFHTAEITGYTVIGKSSKFIKYLVIYVKKLIIMLIQFKFGHILA
jgi:hypothetical protein